MCARKLDQAENDFLLPEPKRSKPDPEAGKKHSLDSDEEDYNTDDENLLDENDIEGEEEGVARQVGNERMTPFNMKEELEEGHFDKDGHFIWHKENEIRDNWLDNIDWQTVKPSKCCIDSSEKGLADDSDSDAEAEKDHFDEIQIYKQILSYIKPKESINKAIRRLGGNKEKMSSVERLKRKKAGTLNISEDVTKLTELANKILTETGNMDIYQETYENIMKKIEVNTKKGKAAAASEPELDMYADDFGEKEKNRKERVGEGSSTMDEKEDVFEKKEVQWEFIWDKDNQRVEGPYSTAQMLKWTKEGYFKDGIWVRKHNEDIFYPSRRIDFELYL